MMFTANTALLGFLLPSLAYSYRVPLSPSHHRSLLQRSSSSPIDFSVGVKHASFVQSKINAGLATFQAKVGSQSVLVSAREEAEGFINDVSSEVEVTMESLQDTITGIVRRAPGQEGMVKKMKRQNEALEPEKTNTLWVGTIDIGTPARSYLIDFDTGSSDIWVMSSTCMECIDAGKTGLYNISASSTAKSLQSNFSISYGDGSTTSGPLYEETISVAGIKVKDQAFSPVTEISSSFFSTPQLGLLGLAFPSISTTGSTPFFQNVIKQGTVREEIFSVKLSSTPGESELYLGGSDEEYYEGAIRWTDLVEESYWSIASKVKVNGHNYTSNAIIDTGSSYIFGDSKRVNEFYEKIPGAGPCPEDICGISGYWVFNCTAVDDLSIEWEFGSAGTHPMSAKTFSLGPVEDGSSSCVGSVYEMNSDLDAWILGDSWMMNIYTIFDPVNNRIGMAKLKN